MITKPEIIQKYDEVNRRLAELRRQSSQYVEADKYELKIFETGIVAAVNETITFDSDEFRNLIAKRKDLAHKISAEILRQVELGNKDDDDEELDDKIYGTYQISGDDILCGKKYGPCPYGLNGTIKKTLLKDILCEGPKTESYCGKCQYNPEVPEEEDEEKESEDE